MVFGREEGICFFGVFGDWGDFVFSLKFGGGRPRYTCSRFALIAL